MGAYPRPAKWIEEQLRGVERHHVQVAAEEQLRGVDRHRVQVAAEAFLLNWPAVLIEGLTDMQPIMMWFGALQSLLEPIARYHVLGVNEHGRPQWQTVPYETYKETHLENAFRKGVWKCLVNISLYF